MIQSFYLGHILKVSLHGLMKPVVIQYPYVLGFWSNFVLHAVEHRYTFFPFVSEICCVLFSSTIILHTGSLNMWLYGWIRQIKVYPSKCKCVIMKTNCLSKLIPVLRCWKQYRRPNYPWMQWRFRFVRDQKKMQDNRSTTGTVHRMHAYKLLRLSYDYRMVRNKKSITSFAY